MFEFPVFTLIFTYKCHGIHTAEIFSRLHCPFHKGEFTTRMSLQECPYIKKSMTGFGTFKKPSTLTPSAIHSTGICQGLRYSLTLHVLSEACKHVQQNNHGGMFYAGMSQYVTTATALCSACSFNHSHLYMLNEWYWLHVNAALGQD